MTDSQVVHACLSVDRSALLDGVRGMVRHARRSASGEVILAFEDGELTVRFGGMEVSAPGTGDWGGEARVAPSWLMVLGQRPPTGDPVELRIVGDRLHVGGFSTPCRWQSVPVVRLELPMNPSLPDVLRLALDRSDAEIEAAGLRQPVAAAQARRRELLDRAVKILGDLGVSAREVEGLVDAAVRRRHDPGART